MTKIQIYSHYKLPITMDPLKFGKLLDQTNNKFIIQLSTKNVAVINHYDKENFVRIFKNGDLVLEFRDKFVSETSFIRTLNDTKFLFDNDRLISTQIINALGSITIFNNNPLYEDTNALQLKQNFRNSIFKLLENTYIYKHKKAELFILFELFLIFIICFVIFPDVDSVNTSLAVFSKGNIIKLRRTLNRNAWDEYKISLNNKIFSKNLFENLIKKFWNKIEYRFTNDNHLYLLLKIQYNDGNFASIGSLQRLNKDDLNWYIDFILSLVQFKSEYYKTNQIKEIIITYGFKNKKIPNKIIIASTSKTTEFNKVNIINSMIPSDFGSILKTIKTENSTIFIIQNELGQTITLEQFENYNLVTIAAKGTILISFKDEFINNNEFIRTIDNKKYYFKNNSQVLFMKELKTKFISKIKKSEELTNKFITLDIETFIKNGELIPYLICIYDGENKLVFWLWDYNSVEEMILEALNSILIRKYNGYKVYIHETK